MRIFIVVPPVYITVMSDLDFRTRVRNNGVKLKNVPNVEEVDGVFSLSDYVSKDPGSWGMVPENPDEFDVEGLANEMYEIYEQVANYYEEVTLNRNEDGDMYWADLEVDIPEDPSRQERIAEDIAESILARQQL